MVGDLYLKLPGVTGNSLLQAHQGELELMSYELGVERPPSAVKSGVGSARALFAPLRVTLRPDLAGPQLLLLAAGGAVLPTAVLTTTAVSEDGDLYTALTLTLTSASVLEAVVGQERGEDAVMTVSLDYRKVQYVARRPKPDGTFTTTTAAWDIVANRSA